jgi:hypothetical protein
MRFAARERSSEGGHPVHSVWALATLLLLGCGRAPPSQFPSARDALERLHATTACARGVSAEAKLDYMGSGGRIKAEVLYISAVPDRVRFDVVSPFGPTLSTLAANGKDFTFSDLRQKQFIHGPANACNLARFTRVPLAPHALGDLLRGDAPVLVHRPEAASIAWEGSRYVLRIDGAHGARQTLEIEPIPDDFERPWREQRIRVLAASVEQLGVPLYAVELDDHAPALTAPARVDPDGLDPPTPPSGPACSVELARRIHFEVPTGDHDLVLALKNAVLNPPLVGSVFEPERPRGLRDVYSPCD